MKTFEDLIFEPFLKYHTPTGYKDAKQAILTFENEYCVSVLIGNQFGSNGFDRYELAILFDGEVAYNTGICDGVSFGLTKDEVSSIMIKVQQLQ